jgi:hypothetical protein
MQHPPLNVREASQADPVFVLCAARTGSTLLRFLLDAHPDLACPPETELPLLCSQLAKTWSLLAGVPLHNSRTGEPPVLPGPLTAGIRYATGQMIAQHLAHRGKRRLCDKSMFTARHASLLLQVFPEAKFICLYRHPMDMIASGIEACPWGLKGYGFDAYAASSPGNDVHALARYWADHCAEILAVEERYPQACLRVRYEDLVDDPEAAAGRVFGFLGVPPSPGVSVRCFSPERERIGPADYKIWQTSRVSAGSVGRGWSVPADQIEAATRARLNDLAGKLGYVQVDGKWSVADTTPDLRVDGAPPLAPSPATSTREMPRGALVLGDRLQAGLFRLSDRFARRWGPCAGESFLVVATSQAGDDAAVRWRVDLAARTVTLARADDAGSPGGIAWQLTGSAATWGRVLTAAVNLNVALRHRDLRYCDTGTVPGPVTVARIDMLADLLGVTSWRPAEGQAVPVQARPLQALPAQSVPVQSVPAQAPPAALAHLISQGASTSHEYPAKTHEASRGPRSRGDAAAGLGHARLAGRHRAAPGHQHDRRRRAAVHRWRVSCDRIPRDGTPDGGHGASRRAAGTWCTARDSTAGNRAASPGAAGDRAAPGRAACSRAVAAAASPALPRRPAACRYAAACAEPLPPAGNRSERQLLPQGRRLRLGLCRRGGHRGHAPDRGVAGHLLRGRSAGRGRHRGQGFDL